MKEYNKPDVGRIDVSDERSLHYNFGRKPSNGIAVSYSILLKLQPTMPTDSLKATFETIIRKDVDRDLRLQFRKEVAEQQVGKHSIKNYKKVGRP